MSRDIDLSAFLGTVSEEMMEVAEAADFLDQKNRRIKEFSDGTPVKESHCVKPARMKGGINAREWSERFMEVDNG